jgi:hypothetical protein
MGSFVNMVLGAGLAVAVVLTFWLLAGFVGDAQHR